MLIRKPSEGFLLFSENYCNNIGVVPMRCEACIRKPAYAGRCQTSYLVEPYTSMLRKKSSSAQSRPVGIM